MPPVDLVIFDCDGVLVDTDRIALRLQAERLREIGYETDYVASLREFLGIGVPATMAIVEARLGRPVPVGWREALDAETDAQWERELRSIDGIEGVLDDLDRRGLACCIASGGSHEKMRRTLGLTGLFERFDGRIFSADEVARSKPAPDLFMHAAARMGVDSSLCIVVEDSPAGVAAAHAAGMRVLAYAGETPADMLSDADFVLTVMADLPTLIDAGTEARG